MGLTQRWLISLGGKKTPEMSSYHWIVHDVYWYNNYFQSAGSHGSGECFEPQQQPIVTVLSGSLQPGVSYNITLTVSAGTERTAVTTAQKVRTLGQRLTLQCGRNLNMYI